MDFFLDFQQVGTVHSSWRLPVYFRPQQLGTDDSNGFLWKVDTDETMQQADFLGLWKQYLLYITALLMSSLNFLWVPMLEKETHLPSPAVFQHLFLILWILNLPWYQGLGVKVYVNRCVSWVSAHVPWKPWRNWNRDGDPRLEYFPNPAGRGRLCLLAWNIWRKQFTNKTS